MSLLTAMALGTRAELNAVFWTHPGPGGTLDPAFSSPTNTFPMLEPELRRMGPSPAFAHLISFFHDCRVCSGCAAPASRRSEIIPDAVVCQLNLFNLFFSTFGIPFSRSRRDPRF